jgi:DNA-binding LytR/AlgR family response regulator
VIRAVLIDDELPAVERLKKLLRPFTDLDIVGEANDGLSALPLISEKKPDVVFLDIEMPELSGLEVARTLGIEGPLIVFVTAYDEYALAAFESSAIDYLVKPVNADRLQFTIDKVRKSRNQTRANLDSVLAKLRSGPSRLAVRVGQKFEVFDPSAISVLISRDHYTALVVEGRELLSDDSLESILTRLDTAEFIRVHRGAALNIKFLKELKREGDRKFTAILADRSQSQVPVSRERLPILKKFLGLD